MKKIEIKIPQLSESTGEATILKWKKKEGEIVKKQENLVNIETDKIVMEINSPDNGKIEKIIKNNKEKVKSNEIIGIINIKKKENNINKKKKDISILELKKKNKIKTNKKRIKKIIPMSNLRLKIAKRLIESQKTNAILTTFNEIDMHSLIKIKKKYKKIIKDKYKIKLGLTSFFVKAVTHALKIFPILNASIDKKNIIYHKYCDIGIAISSKRGLVVPVIKNAESMSVIDIEIKIKKLIKKAENGKLKIKELTGGTFTISNGGVFGSMLSTPIINPPQSAILGIHANKDRVIAKNKKIVIRPINYCALSYDHRLIDGKEAILGLMKIKEIIENPLQLLLNLD